MERESERSQDLLGVDHSKSGFFWRFREDDKVIGVSHMTPTLGFDILIKGVEDHVGEQRRDDAPLRSALGRDADDAIVADTGFEEGLEKSNDTAICDPRADAVYHHLVVDSVEKGGDVCVNDVDVTIPGVLNCGGDSVMRFATGPETEAASREMRFEDRGQDLIDRLLTHAVDYDGNTQGTHLLGVGGLGDVDATDHLRFEAVFHELAL